MADLNTWKKAAPPTFCQGNGWNAPWRLMFGSLSECAILLRAKSDHQNDVGSGLLLSQLDLWL
ncbi:MAG: hypothetical protein CL862_06545 [Cyanobium sp. NAT70]|nr:hypothetical protein [Cyanobium sp. NAT70]